MMRCQRGREVTYVPKAVTALIGAFRRKKNVSPGSSALKTLPDGVQKLASVSCSRAGSGTTADR
jgi:hypothetical protein